METIEKSVDVLNDLIKINNDRVEGFEKAAKDLGDGNADLKAIFERFATQSRSNVAELTSEVTQLGGEVETGSGVAGSLHRAWIDVKATFSGHDRKSVLEECERGEDAIKKAYREALDPNNELGDEATAIISKQKTGIDAGHDEIKALRDSQA
jgi:uncharacterized protein (TIGR02284 family)